MRAPLAGWYSCAPMPSASSCCSTAEVVADHPRQFRRDQDYLRSLALSAGSREEAGRITQRRAIQREWSHADRLGSSAHAKLKSHPDGDRQFVKVLGAVPDHGLALSRRPTCAEALQAGIANGDVILTVLARRLPGPRRRQHHHARCAAPEDRAHGRLRPLRQHEEGSLMERHEILDAMSELNGSTAAARQLRRDRRQGPRPSRRDLSPHRQPDPGPSARTARLGRSVTASAAPRSSRC